MIPQRTLTAIIALVSAASAWDAPNYAGFGRVWQETFAGAKGSSPNRGNWNIIDGNLGVNNELQTYTSKTRNVQLSGGGTLQLVPWKDGSAPRGWTSGRLEGSHLVTPEAGKVTRVEAAVRFGGNPVDRKQGIWPAFWMLGHAIRNGAPWPACGEIDIMESVNGQLSGYGTVHCNVFPGGICNEGTGIGGSTAFPDQGWHTWRVEFDRRPGNWLDQSISWYMDGRLFHQIRGNRINNPGVWASLCNSPLFFILNVAVGGNWPGYPNGNTFDGYGSMLEVGYVAHYTAY
ncbi:glycosyl hydrolases family 16 domain-containing protein [Hirsutella rhossiliensis]|uniref:Glycosyl hydrolases family 16 domain-containing protein n=1 Tax=Hirsutella rhossiliensis TaxID=111463 RepID=A0A9P8N656_9HYPO|nr:glycosyl hydrolases family 16 domain-containing protein [Hirsutella rhossiliensis]KAH0967682.1 glycosyl hydrolases family 16 domain-containing protein [Hirsutella rhossiliensis]